MQHCFFYDGESSSQMSRGQDNRACLSRMALKRSYITQTCIVMTGLSSHFLRTTKAQRIGKGIKNHTFTHSSSLIQIMGYLKKLESNHFSKVTWVLFFHWEESIILLFSPYRGSDNECYDCYWPAEGTMWLVSASCWSLAMIATYIRYRYTFCFAICSHTRDFFVI